MIHFNQASKNFGKKVLYENASFQLNSGEKVGLVGSNGAGKTTLFRVIVGEDSLDRGEVIKAERTVVGYFSQDVAEMKGGSVLEEVMSGAGEISRIGQRLEELGQQLSEPLSEDEMTRVLTEYGEIQSEFESRGGYDLKTRAKEIVTGLGFPPEDHDRSVESYSGGWKMRIELAKILLLNPDVLLMDEPTNHLDLESIIWLEEWLQAYKGALFMTSHDRDFMNRLVTKIVEVANKSITTYSGNYDFYIREREIRRTQLAAAAKRQQDMLAKEEEFIARFAARASHAAQVQSRIKKLEKIERIEAIPEEKVVRFTWPNQPRGGDQVVKFSALSKVWKTQDREISVFQGATATVQRLDRVAVVGVNGAGKSTLLKIIAGQTEPTSGTITLGSSVEVGYFSQNSLDVLNPKYTVQAELHSHIPTASIETVRGILGAFLFSGEEVEKPVAALSGGEKSRLVLASIFAKPVNLLILDEPTNHLDITTREILLDAVLEFPGTVMIVSHDRHFLREMTTRVFQLDHHELTVTDGSWDYYLEKKASRG